MVARLKRAAPPKTCAWGIASQHGLLVLLQSFRFPQFVARGLRSCLSSRDREMATCESCKFRASLASIWQNCVLERVPDLLLLSAELVVDGDFQLFYPSRAAPLLCRRWYLSSVKRGNQHVARCVPYLVRGTRSGARYHNQIHGFPASKKSCRSCNPRKNGGVTYGVNLKDRIYQIVVLMYTGVV